MKGSSGTAALPKELKWLGQNRPRGIGPRRVLLGGVPTMFGLSWQMIIGATLLLGMAFGMSEIPGGLQNTAFPGENLRVACATESPLCEPGSR
jgi:hypothetical protein